MRNLLFVQMHGRQRAGLRENWRRLHEEGTRRPEHPLARGWPQRFAGSFREYEQFEERRFDLAGRIKDTAYGLKSRWGNAALDQHFLPYNFSAKPDWPWQMEP